MQSRQKNALDPSSGLSMSQVCGTTGGNPNPCQRDYDTRWQLVPSQGYCPKHLETPPYTLSPKNRKEP